MRHLLGHLVSLTMKYIYEVLTRVRFIYVLLVKSRGKSTAHGFRNTFDTGEIDEVNVLFNLLHAYRRELDVLKTKKWVYVDPFSP